MIVCCVSRPHACVLKSLISACLDVADYVSGPRPGLWQWVVAV